MKAIAWTFPLFLTASLAGCDSKKDATDPEPAAKADAKSEAASAAADGVKTPKAARPQIAGIPPAAKLSPLPEPAGPDADGNVAKDVEVAMGAKDCKIEDGKLVDCPAAEAYGKLQNNWVVAKPPARAKTMINLLGAQSPAVRLLVLDEHPLQFIDSFAEELREDPKTYEPYFAAALAETDPNVRAGFAWDLRYAEVLEKHPSFLKYVGAMAQSYSDDEAAEELLKVLSYADDGTEASPARPLLLGVAARNPDARVRARAVAMLAALVEDTKSIPMCELALGAVETGDEDRERSMAEILAGAWGDCSKTREAWLAMFVPKAKAGTLDSVWVQALLNTGADDEAGAKELRELGAALAKVVPEDHELRYDVETLLEYEA